MPRTHHCQGRTVEEGDLIWIGELIGANPQWSLHRVSKEVCLAWEWKTGTGVLKTFAARSLLLKLEERGLVAKLPAIRINQRRVKRPPPSLEDLGICPPASPIRCRLKELQPLQIFRVAPGSEEDNIFLAHLVSHHYLGLRSIVGENLRYLVRDCAGRAVACLLFGSSAWKSRARDQFIGWLPPERESNLHLTTNNCRFLIFPWVVVPHLASHVLARVTGRLKNDWQQHYGHPIHLVETFVEGARFSGTCYRAANWVRAGQTVGRTRQDRYNEIEAPVKDIYLYGLSSDWRARLGKSQ